MRNLVLAVLLLIGTTAYAQYPLMCDPSTVKLDRAELGRWDSVAVVLTNTTGFTISGLTFSVDGNDATSFLPPPYVPGIRPYEQIVVPVLFYFDRPGQHTARVLIHAFVNDSVLPELAGIFYIEAIADTIYGGITPLYQTVRFGTVEVGRTAFETFSITNTSYETITLTPSPTGPNMTFLDSSGALLQQEFSVGPLETVIITAAYTPTEPGTIFEYLLLTWKGQVATVEFSANAVMMLGLDVTWSKAFDGIEEVRDQPGEFIAGSIGSTDTWIARIRNNQATPHTVFAVTGIVGLPSPFAMPMVTGPFTIAPYGYHDVEVVYTGHGPEPYYDIALFFDDTTMFAAADLVGYVYSPNAVRVGLGTMSGRPGTRDSLDVVLGSDLPLVADSAQIALTFNTSVLVPLFPLQSDQTANGQRTVVTTVPVTSHTSGSPIGALPFLITLGDAQRSQIEFARIRWLDKDGIEVAILSETGNGVLVVIDERTVNANAGSIGIAASPMPVSDNLRVDYSGVKGSVTVDLYDLTGLRLVSVPGQVTNGRGSVNIDCSIFAGGTYAIRVSDSSSTSVRRIIIE
jgi:hypothetical protein